MATIGSVGEFVPENETITAYLERVQLFMDANAVEKAGEGSPRVVERHRRKDVWVIA